MSFLFVFLLAFSSTIRFFTQEEAAKERSKSDEAPSGPAEVPGMDFSNDDNEVYWALLTGFSLTKCLQIHIHHNYKYN